MPSRHALLLCAALLAAAFLAVPAHLAAQKPYRVLDTWKLGGDGGWDYLLADPDAHRLYLTRGARVDVVDTQSGKIIGSIVGLHGTHGVALDTAGKFGYISDGGGNAVVVFDRASLATVATIPAGANPDAIVFEPATHTVWAFNGRSNDATVIDAKKNKVVATIPLPGKPEFAAVDGHGALYDNIEDKNEIVRLDAKQKMLTALWPLTGCDGPSGLAIDPSGSRLFSVCHNKTMAVTDAKTGKPLASAVIGDGPDAAAWSATRKLAFSSNGGGWSASGASPDSASLTVVDASDPGYPVLQNLPTQRGARTMAYDSATDRIYLVTAGFGPRPAPTPDNPHPRPAILPGSFTVLVVGR
ncbi:MAG: YncE family protein [Terracidiphilus sp.]|jgi:YVTN family beta-propeller protein